MLHRLLHNLTIKNTSSDDQHVQINCYHNNNTSEPTAVQLCLERRHTRRLTNQVAGMAPCDSATSICRSEIICLQLKPSEPQRARSSPWLNSLPIKDKSPFHTRSSICQCHHTKERANLFMPNMPPVSTFGRPFEHCFLIKRGSLSSLFFFLSTNVSLIPLSSAWSSHDNISFN